MITQRHRNLFRQKRFFALVSVILAGISAAASVGANANTPLQSELSHRALLLSYQQLRTQLEHNNFNAPVVVRSSVDHGRVTGHVYAIVNHPFSQLNAMFSSARQWCDASTLHINIKFCTNTHVQDKQANLTLFVGDKGYQEPDKAFRLDYHYRITRQTPQFIQTRLTAKNGPIDSKDYKIAVAAIPLDNKTSFMHFSYSVRYGLFSRMLLKVYLATAASDRVGFTTQGIDKNGNTIYIKGMQGMAERNAMQYFLALKSYLDTHSLPPKQRFEASLNKWFDSTLKYRKQLYEETRQEYLNIKYREHSDGQYLKMARNHPQEDSEADMDF
jgi:hypothetical protein